VGLVTELSPWDQYATVNMVKVLYSKDPIEAADTMVSLTRKQARMVGADPVRFRADLEEEFRDIFSIPDEERGLSRTMQRVFGVMRQHHVKMESNVAMLAVRLISTENSPPRVGFFGLYCNCR
jgi:predicted unusual protein kinase regulating ubiquinone biosynthesis (AarF/ABC1/UbiB family)